MKVSPRGAKHESGIHVLTPQQLRQGSFAPTPDERDLRESQMAVIALTAKARTRSYAVWQGVPDDAGRLRTCIVSEFALASSIQKRLLNRPEQDCDRLLYILVEDCAKPPIPEEFWPVFRVFNPDLIIFDLDLISGL